MKFVDPADPVFLQEQRMWAEDLRRRTRPESFSFSHQGPRPRSPRRERTGTAKVADPKDAAAAGRSPSSRSEMASAEASGMEGSHWTLKGWKSPRTVSWKARFRKSGVRLGLLRRAVESLHAAEGVLDVLRRRARRVGQGRGRGRCPSVRKHVHTRALASRTSRRLRPARAGGEAVRLDAAPAGVDLPELHRRAFGGWNEPGEAVKLLVGRRTQEAGRPASPPRPRVRPRRDVRARHCARMPWWILEGVAELSAEAFHSKSRERQRPDGSPLEEADGPAPALRRDERSSTTGRRSGTARSTARGTTCWAYISDQVRP
jgi:hypothetical protein